ncbi:MAG: hypothetical protein SGCHY_005537 [Lobulomycetales sp.]
MSSASGSNTGAAAAGEAAASAKAPLKPIQVKLVLLGEAAVGKSSLVLRFVNNEFVDNKEPTIGAAFLTQKCKLQDKIIKFEIWDTAGQERFHSLAPMYYRNAQAAVVVYDISKAASLDKAKSWVKELQRQANPNIIIALVGNKLDLGEDARTVPAEEAQAFATEQGLLFAEASAKTGEFVMEVFTDIVHRGLVRHFAVSRLSARITLTTMSSLVSTIWDILRLPGCDPGFDYVRDWMPAQILELFVRWDPLTNWFPHDFRSADSNHKDNRVHQRVLYVVNHTTLALDTPFVFSAISRSREETSRNTSRDTARREKSSIHWPRGLADRLHFVFPIWRHALMFFGAVEGSPQNCETLMQQGYPVLVYPGGSREVMRKSGDEPYTLFWKERTGFARMAIQHGYSIVPVASVGLEEMIHIAMGIVGWAMGLIGDKRSDMTVPLIVPRLSNCNKAKFHVRIGDAIDTARFCGDANKENQITVRNETRSALEALISGVLDNE